MTISKTNLPAAPAPFVPAPLSTEQQQTITNLVLGGDLSKMDGPARVSYYVQLCQSLNLNPHTQPFQILKFQGKEIMYATKSCTEQLRKQQGVSVTGLEHREKGDVYLVVCTVTDATGRIDVGTGAVATTNLKGEALANAFMKAETKAKRRATLSICGLGMLDESELDTMPQAVQVGLPQAAEIGTSAEVVAEPARVHVPGTVATQAEIDEREIAGHRTRLMYAKKLEDVVQIWSEVPKHLKPELVVDKEKAKNRFVQPPKAQPVRDEQLMAEFVEQPELGMNLPATNEQRAEIQRLCNLQTITPGEKADMLKVLYKLDEVRAGQMLFKLLNEMALREGLDADKEMRQALHRFTVNYAEQLGSDAAERLRKAADDKNLHWQQVRAKLLAAKEWLAAQAVPA
jgi:hypothetical protein